jgi:hypothetical protein
MQSVKLHSNYEARYRDKKKRRSEGTILALYAFPLAHPLKVQQPSQVHCIPRNPRV